MNIKLCRKKHEPVKKGKYIDKNIATQLIEISRGVRAFREEKYAKAIQYLEKKALHPNATERIKFIVGASYVETKICEKEATELLKAIIQKYKDLPKENRIYIYSRAILAYAKIQLRNELTEFAIYLLEDIIEGQDDIEILTELSKAYDIHAQDLREKDKKEEAVEIEQKAEELCLKCKKISEINNKIYKKSISARKLLGILYIRQGKIENAEQEFNEIKKMFPRAQKEQTLFDMNCMHLLKQAYFKEESEQEVNKRIEKLENTQGDKKEYAREIDLIGRQEYYEQLSPELKISKGIDIFRGYKMYEYPKRGVCVIDKIFDEIKDGKKVLGTTYIFPQDIKIDLEKLSREEVIKMLDTESSIQRQEHRGDYYNSIQEKMKRAELEGLVLEEKNLKEKEKILEKSANIVDKKEEGEP